VSDPRPVLFVTNHVPAHRVGAFAALHAREEVEYALIGGAVRHGGPLDAGELPFPVRRVSERAIAGLAAAGRHRAVVAGLSGRLAPAAAFAGARRARVPFVLWATLWAHPRTPAHVAGYPLVHHLYRQADAIATYGPHVSAYVQSKGVRNPVFEAPQAVDNGFWSVSTGTRSDDRFRACFVGRLSGEKGVTVLLKAWRASGLLAPSTALVLVGGGPFRARAAATGADVPGPLPPEAVREHYAHSDVVVVPSIKTRDFREPWALVVNEAFNQGVPVIASDAVGAAAGGLVRHEQTGLVVPGGDAGALASALRRLHHDPALRRQLGARARDAVSSYTFQAWAAGMSRALDAVGAARSRSDLPEASLA
jgi:glycosyltransferase involved in cell wall biosynthesis